MVYLQFNKQKSFNLLGNWEKLAKLINIKLFNLNSKLK